MNVYGLWQSTEDGADNLLGVYSEYASARVAELIYVSEHQMMHVYMTRMNLDSAPRLSEIVGEHVE